MRVSVSENDRKAFIDGSFLFVVKTCHMSGISGAMQRAMPSLIAKLRPAQPIGAFLPRMTETQL